MCPLIGHREQPPDPSGDGILRHGRVRQRPELLETRLPVFNAELASFGKVVWHFGTEDFKRPLDTCGSCDSCTGRAPHIGVIEIRQAVRGRAHFATHAPLLPLEDGFMRSHTGKERADRIAITHDHPIDIAHFSCFGADTQSPGAADEGKGGFRARTGDFEGAGATWLRQRTVGKKGTAPSCFGIANTTGYDGRRQSPYGPLVCVDKTHLHGKALTTFDNPHDIPSTFAQSRWLNDGDFCRMTENLGDVLLQSSRRHCVVEFGFNDQFAAHEVEGSTETEEGCYLSLTATCLGDGEMRQLVLH